MLSLDEAQILNVPSKRGVSQPEPSSSVLAEQATIPDVAADHLQRAVPRLVHDCAFAGTVGGRLRGVAGSYSVKPLYGRQQGAERGYNPPKPGRPSHVYHTYFVANPRLLLEVEMQPGNQTASSYAQPVLWEFLDGLEPEQRPALLRGDIGWRTERMMLGAEQRQLPYLFKSRQSRGLKGLLERLFRSEEWEPAGRGWQGIRTELMLQGWSRTRPLVVLRRQIRNDLALTQPDPAAPKQLSLGWAEVVDHGVLYEYAVLVSSLDEEVATIAQHYRERADAENNVDELKNQWNWSGFTTPDLLRCQELAFASQRWSTAGVCLRGWLFPISMRIPGQADRHSGTMPITIPG